MARKIVLYGDSIFDNEAYADYAECSLIEPSAQGSRKIAATLRWAFEDATGGFSGSRIYM